MFDPRIRNDLPWAPGRSVLVLDEVDSTQDTLREWAADGAPAGATVLARRQTAGRGRQGRRWEDGGEGNLLVSVLLRHPSPVEQLASFSPLVAFTLERGLAPHVDLELKWPNDLWHHGRKVAGILLESFGDQAPAVMVGLGLNLREPSRGWGELAEVATSLEAAGCRIEATEVLREWLPRLDRAWERFVREGLGPFVETWNGRSVLNGRAIWWRQNGQTHRARVGGMVEDGALEVIDSDGRRRRLHAAEVHLEEVE